ncbi:MAG TPA: hypothetical protein VGG27_13395 [Magnetospirillaceae bacterium]|jgi:hypothetical protein
MPVDEASPLDFCALRTDYLPELRKMLETVDAFRQLIGPIAQFDLVVDANFLIGDVRWMMVRRTNPDARSALRECLSANTILAYVAPHVILEVEEHLPGVAEEYKQDPRQWSLSWEELKQQLFIMAPTLDGMEKYKGGVDPDDAPSLGLADDLGNLFILSNDPHIPQMGGRQVRPHFVIDAREYSRKATISVSLKVGMYSVTFGAIGAVQAAISVLKPLLTWFSRLPIHTKLLLLAPLLVAALTPRYRDKMVSEARRLGAGFSAAWPIIMEVVLEISVAASKYEARPPRLLESDSEEDAT